VLRGSGVGGLDGALGIQGQSWILHADRRAGSDVAVAVAARCRCCLPLGFGRWAFGSPSKGRPRNIF
jgi:hypothetical protein